MLSFGRNLPRFVGAGLIALAIQVGGAETSSAQTAQWTVPDRIWADAETAYNWAHMQKCYSMGVRRSLKELIKEYDSINRYISLINDIISPTDSDIKLNQARLGDLKNELPQAEHVRDTIADWITELSRLKPCPDDPTAALTVDPPSAIVLQPPTPLVAPPTPTASSEPSAPAKPTELVLDPPPTLTSEPPQPPLVEPPLEPRTVDDHPGATERTEVIPTPETDAPQQPSEPALQPTPNSRGTTSRVRIRKTGETPKPLTTPGKPALPKDALVKPTKLPGSLHSAALSVERANASRFATRDLEMPHATHVEMLTRASFTPTHDLGAHEMGAPRGLGKTGFASHSGAFAGHFGGMREGGFGDHFGGVSMTSGMFGGFLIR